MGIERKFKRSRWYKGTTFIDKQIYYSGGHKVFLAFYGTLCALLLTGIITLLFSLITDNKLKDLDGYIITSILISCFSLMPLYGFTLIFKLLTKRITLSVIDGKVILHGAITTKTIRITDIDVIKKANTRQDAILIKAMKNKSVDSHSKMTIPEFWFAKEDLLKFIESLEIQKINKNIKIDL